MNIEKCFTKESPLFVKITNDPADIGVLEYLTGASVETTEDGNVLKLNFEGDDPIFAELGEYVVLFADDVMIYDEEDFQEFFHVG